MSFGNQLKLLRSERKMLQKELAVMLKVSCGTVSNYENGVHFPDEEILGQIADIFEVSADFLLGRTTLRYPLNILNKEIDSDYPLSTMVDKIVSLDPEQQAGLRQYVDYLDSLKNKQPAKK